MTGPDRILRTGFVCGPDQAGPDRNITDIWNFPTNKSPSIGGMHKLWFLIHMALIKNQKPALGMAWGRVVKISSMRKDIVGNRVEKMGHGNGHISGSKPFPKVIISHNASLHGEHSLVPPPAWKVLPGLQGLHTASVKPVISENFCEPKPAWQLHSRSFFVVQSSTCPPQAK